MSNRRWIVLEIVNFAIDAITEIVKFILGGFEE